jgi:hypothetical protein
LLGIGVSFVETSGVVSVSTALVEIVILYHLVKENFKLEVQE